ncbi:hypothetical protein RJT34_10598 [Clitoria ternatea]|uniref:RING-type E3 ubiquitin transferase n=1 Tax=Clitoria ternatea TaxID=43366 RepID=A0AAN9K6X1_CLITE
MPLFHSRVDAQTNVVTNPPWGITLRDNLKSTISVMLLAFFSAFIFTWFFQLYIRHCAYSYAADDNTSPTAAVCGREVIDKCPVLVYSRVKDLKIGKGTLECAVCLSEFQDSDNIRLLPECHHVFHTDCIDAWLPDHMSCPVCRAKLTPDSVVDVAIPVEVEENNTNAVTESSGVETETEAPEQEAVSEAGSRGTCVLGRSHSTGHSLLGPKQEVERMERFTLRLPEHVRERIFVANIPMSGGDMGGEWSSKTTTSYWTPPRIMSYNRAMQGVPTPSSNILPPV